MLAVEEADSVPKSKEEHRPVKTSILGLLTSRGVCVEACSTVAMGNSPRQAHPGPGRGPASLL